MTTPTLAIFVLCCFSAAVSAYSADCSPAVGKNLETLTSINYWTLVIQRALEVGVFSVFSGRFGFAIVVQQPSGTKFCKKIGF